ncbi:MAG: hypothetical protein IKE31_04795 [Eubacterium sp.]|nr:hypothetical protein [Eubacterium sp.]
MSTIVDNTLKLITGHLTGRREKDILFLKEQIDYYRFDSRVTDALEHMLRCLTLSAGSTSAATV